MTDFEISPGNKETVFRPISDRAQKWALENYKSANEIKRKEMYDLQCQIYFAGFNYLIKI